MKFPRLFCLFFCLISAVGFASAQEPFGTIGGTVTGANGLVADANVSVKLKDARGYSSTVERTTDEYGNFSVAALRFGTYIVTAKSSCLSVRDENVEVSSEKKVIVNLALPDENCAEKTASEETEWEACAEEVSPDGAPPTDAEKAEMINTMIAEMLKTDYLGYREKGTFASTANIEPAWIKSYPNLDLIFLSPQKLQARADKEGDFGYLSFSGWQTGKSCAFSGLSWDMAVSKKSKNGYCPVGSSRSFLFRKDAAGSWKLKQIKTH